MEIITGGFADNLVAKFVCAEVGKQFIPGAGHAIGFIGARGLVAGVYFSNYDGTNVVIDAASLPKSRWLDRRGLWAIFHYAFEQLGCERATAFVPESNAKSIKLVTAAGMINEAALERAAPGGERMMVFRMFADECPWLKRGKRDDQPDNSPNPNRSR